jgi:hypothetical protein
MPRESKFQTVFSTGADGDYCGNLFPLISLLGVTIRVGLFIRVPGRIGPGHGQLTA